MLAVVVDHHAAIYHQVAAVVGEQREGVDAVGRYFDVAREDKSDVAMAGVGNAHFGCCERGQERCLVDVGTAGAAVVVPLTA